MKNALIVSFLIPVLAYAYPIYEDDAPLQNFPAEERVKEENRESPLQKQREKREAKLALDSFPFKSKHEPHKRTIAKESASRSKIRHRQNPNRPQVTHRNEKKPPEQQTEDESLSVFQENEVKEVSEITEQEAVKAAE
jgi:hypothetical protein